MSETGEPHESEQPGEHGHRAVDPPPDPQVLTRLWQITSTLMCVQHFDGYLEYSNPAYDRLFGWSVDELRSAPFWEFVHPDDRHPLVEGRQRLLDGRSDSLVHEARLLSRDGSYRWTRWNIEALGDRELLLAVGFDLTGTGRRRAGRVLVGSWVWDVPTDTLTWSDEVLAMFGRPRGSELTVDRLLEAVHPEDRSRVDRALRWCLASGDPFTEAFRIVRPDGEVRTLHTAGRVTLGTNGDPVRMRGLTRDLSDAPGPAPDPEP